MIFFSLTEPPLPEGPRLAILFAWYRPYSWPPARNRRKKRKNVGLGPDMPIEQTKLQDVLMWREILARPICSDGERDLSCRKLVLVVGLPQKLGKNSRKMRKRTPTRNRKKRKNTIFIFFLFFLFRAGGPKWGLYQANRIANSDPKDPKLGGCRCLGEGRLPHPGQVWELRFLPSFPSFPREN